MPRLIRLIIVMVSIPALFVAFAIATLLVYIFTAIAFSGSTGEAHTAFWEGLEPLFRFFVGALAAGGIASLVNAVATVRGAWLVPIALISVVGGAAAVLSPRIAVTLTQFAMPAFDLAAKIVFAKPDRRAEEARVLEFTRTNEVVRAAAGESPTVSIYSYISYHSGALPARYEVAVTGRKTVFAIVEVNSRVEPAAFSLLCTTPLSMGQRDSSKNACAQ